MTAVQAEQAVPVYAAACAGYALAGWTGVIPVPPEAKFPPPAGFTGAPGRDTTPEDIAGWAQTVPGYSIALRMPDGVIGIDIDEYVKGTEVKHGAATVAAAEAGLGPLPPTYSSTARGPGQPSRIMFYRVPPGRYASELGPDVEIIQRHHRYAVVAPSPHYAIGTPYAWYAPDGAPLEARIPGPGDLAELPETWVRFLAEGAAAAGPGLAAYEEGAKLLASCVLPGEPACVAVAGTAAAWTQDVTAAEAGSRHDALTKAVYELVMLGAEGHPGCGDALAAMQELWAQVTAGEGREGEFSGPSGFLVTAARKAAAKYPGGRAPADPCMFVNSQVYQAPAPEPADGEIPRPVEPAQAWSPFQAIGTEPFTPAGGLDAPLAREVLHRTWPALRYAPDAGAWITRGPVKWEARRGDLSKWAVDLVSWLMLRGDKNAPDGSEEQWLYNQRVRFTTNATSNAIAGKMGAQVAAGNHPSAIELADLDSEREILWAGGTAYDLRNSAQAPAVSAWTDPGSPHLHSAGVIPQLRETPLWDNFTAAVWPDAALRAWALRVLSIAFTGYSDKALPILLGQSDGGKTSIIVLLMSVLGSYAHVADARLLSPADRSHASIVYALKGRRLSFIDEAPRAGQLATERLKQITGGAELTGNRMHENPVTFSPTHTLILTANPEHEPHLNDAAVRRRVRLIPCNGDPAAVRAARAAIGAENGPAWRAEAPGVMAAMMAEAARWLADPESGRSAVEEIRVSQDLVLQWLGEECEPWATGAKSRELYMAFTDSCRRMAIIPAAIPSETLWGRRLSELGYPSWHTAAGNRRALRIRPPQGFMPTADELSGATGGGTRGTEGFTPHETASFQTLHEPVTNGNSPGQTIHTTVHNEGLNGTQPDIAHMHTHTHTRTQEKCDSPFIPSSLQPDPPAEQPPVDEIQKPEVSPKVTKPRKEKAPAKPHPNPALEGPVYQLPVIVARDPGGGIPRVVPCTPEQAALLAGQYLDALCVDCETTGYWPGHADNALRTVQLGGELVAADLDPADPAQAAVITDLITRARKLHAHSAVADLVPLAATGLASADEMWAKAEDSVLIAKLADPSLAGSDENELKRLSAALLGDYAVSPAAEKARSALFKSGKWATEVKATDPVARSGWAQVKTGCETMARYAGSDVLDLAGVLRVLPRPDEAVLAREREFQMMCARISHQGFRLDHAHIQAKIAEHTGLQGVSQQLVSGLTGGAITNPSSSKEVTTVLHAMGIPLGRTKDGNPSAAKDVLEPLAANPAYEHHELARGILDFRHYVTTLGLLLEPLNTLCEHGDGRMHPVVYTINADTGRTCIPDDHGLVTPTGFVKAQDVQPGMRTMDADGNWVRVTGVHRYPDAPVLTLDSRGLQLAGTPEHRWVTTLEHRPDRPRELRRLGDCPRLRVHLAPDAEPFGFSMAEIPARTDGQRFAALIGMLVTDGRCRDDGPGEGLRAYVYQTERKFYREFLRAIPDGAVMYDRLTRPVAREIKPGHELAPVTDHHEIRIKARWLRPRLEAAGLGGDGLVLKDSPSLFAWVAGLPADELRAFFAACWLADGTLWQKGRRKSLSCGSANLRQVLALAACRLGFVMYEFDQDGGHTAKPRMGLAVREPVISTHRVTPGRAQSDVWCVTTETGTFSAVSSQGMVYVTGNSCVRPNGQQFARQGGIRACVIADEGMAGISADFSGLEIRVGAALSGDADLLAAETSTRCLACGGDPCSPGLCGKDQTGLHWMAALMAFGAGATKEDRYNCKRIIFCVPEDDTQILTRRGWLAHDEVRAGDETMGRNPETGLLEWTPVTAVEHFGESELVRIANKDSGWEATVTPGHRWATVKRRDGGNRGRYFQEGMTETRDLGFEHTLILGALAVTEDQVPITPAEAALIGWAYTDGHVLQSPLTGRTSQGLDGRRRKLQISIAQAKPEGIRALEKVLADCGADYIRDDHPLDGRGSRTMPSAVWRLRTEYARELWRRAGLLDTADKAMPGFALEPFVLRLGTGQRAAFFQACMDAEGFHDSKGYPRISQNEGPVLDAIKLAATLEGYYVREHTVKRDPRGNAPHSVLVLSRPKVGGTRLRKTPAGSAPVWCVTTGNGTWLMRQNGRIMLTGNSKMFGGSPRSGAAQVGIAYEASLAIHRAFERIAPRFAEWDQQMRAYLDAGNRGYQAYSGRVIWLPRGRAHAAGNYAIQGTARELLVDGSLRWHRTRWGKYPILPIHDELFTWVPAAEAAEALQTLIACMAGNLYGVPIVASGTGPFLAWPDSS
jgi:hypothetical protein